MEFQPNGFWEFLSFWLDNRIDWARIWLFFAFRKDKNKENNNLATSKTQCSLVGIIMHIAHQSPLSEPYWNLRSLLLGIPQRFNFAMHVEAFLNRLMENVYGAHAYECVEHEWHEHMCHAAQAATHTYMKT